MDYVKSVIIETINDINTQFQSDELAYLALTTKIELPFRHRWAFYLQQKLGTEYIVSREWQRTDIAILKDDKPVMLLELKAMYTFDAVFNPNGISGYKKRLIDDFNKAKNLAENDTQIYTVLLATAPQNIVPQNYDKVIKYRDGINKCLKKVMMIFHINQIGLLSLRWINILLLLKTQ